jgi:hypothetical protein
MIQITDFKGLRKWSIALSAIASATACVAFGWIDGQQYVATMSITVGSFLTANVMAAKKAA